jgi:hypothetical protein
MVKHSDILNLVRRSRFLRDPLESSLNAKVHIYISAFLFISLLILESSFL